ncbi:MAG: amidohydrolase [Chloroflexi bacterium]|nr:amidohydrolase [Chloroflexota bacterium]
MPIFYNANILTMDPPRPRARVLVTSGERILAVGGDDLRRSSTTGVPACRSRATPQTREIDCRGLTLLPGFHDAHCHILSLAGSLLNLDCSPANVRSIQDIQEIIARAVESTPPGEWIVGEGYDEFHLRRHPDRGDLDRAACGRPVRLNHRSGHAWVLNTKALELAGITIETPDPPGGLIERSLQTGQPTGLLFEMDRYLQNTPPPDENRLLRGVKLAGERCLSLGITSLQDATAGNDVARWQLFQRIKEKGLLPTRVTMMVGWEALGTPGSRQPHPGGTGVPACGGGQSAISNLKSTGTRQRAATAGNLESGAGLRVGAVKIVLDRTTGRLHPSQAEFEEAVLAAHRAGLQVAIHAIEEDDIEAALTAIEKARVARASLPVRAAGNLQSSICNLQSTGTRQRAATAGNLQSPRHRIEHCSVCPDRLIARIRKAGVVVVTQPGFIHHSGDRYLATVPPQQQPYLYRLGALLRAGVPLAAGSDAPVAPINPLAGVCAAVTRRTKGGQTILPGEAIGVEQALALYTSGAAYSCFEEDYKGTLSPGKLADLVLLDRDPTTVPPEEIGEIKVAMTVIGGRVCWQDYGTMLACSKKR